MNVMDVARAIGVVATTGEVSGTIDEQKVLGALANLAEDDASNVDLYDAVAERVRLARSAGAEGPQTSSTLIRLGEKRSDDVATTQLRYRSEMADLFVDLAIDVGLRRPSELVAAA